MKKYLFILFLLVSLGAFAQAEIPFYVPDLGQLTIATSTSSDGINIRQKPSKQAPRLMVDESKIDCYETPLKYYGFWSTSPTGGSIHPITFVGPALVVARQDGWLMIHGIGPKGSDGWVSAKYCEVQAPQPFTASVLNNCDNYLPIEGDFGMLINYSEMDDYGSIYIGKMVNSIFVCRYYVEFSLTKGAAKDDFKSDGKGSGTAQYSTTAQDLYDVNFSFKGLKKFTDDILKAAKELSSPVLYINHEGTIIPLYI